MWIFVSGDQMSGNVQLADQARDSAGNQQQQVLTEVMEVYDIDWDEGLAPKMRDQGKKLKEHQHLSNMKRKETENEVREIIRQPVLRRCGLGQMLLKNQTG